jgi:MSHA biogenesis protein MshL
MKIKLFINKLITKQKIIKNIAISSILFTVACNSLRYSTDHLVYSDSFLRLTEWDMFNKLRNLELREYKEREVQGNKKGDKMRLADVIYTPEEPSAVSDKLVSINVTEEVPILDLILEIGRTTGSDIQIDPAITGGIILNLKDKPLRYVFNRICGMTDIRYREKNGILVFERDIPYAKTYYLDFLDMTRSSSSSMSMSTSVISQNSGGSSASISVSSSDEFWDNIKADIKQLIDVTEKTYRSYSTVAKASQKKQIANGELSADAGGDTQTVSTSSNDGNSESPVSGGEMTFNKRAGIVTITASEKSHRRITEYLKDLKRKATAQVLIEMKFVEVTLNKKYQAGIDWSALSQAVIKNGSQVGLTALGGTNIMSLTARSVGDNGIEATLKALENFGTTRTLQNPRINAINNQPSLITFANNRVYFKTSVSYTGQQQASGGSLTNAVQNVQATPETVPIGVVMSVLPSIDLDNRIILLNLKPTISKEGTPVQDPSVAAAGKANGTNATNSIPQTVLRELDTILKLKDGELKVVGGFTERSSSISENGIPFLRSIPLIGALFKFKAEEQNVVETVILVKATIIDNNIGSDLNEFEKSIYKNFSDDPRSYTFDG